MTTDYDALRKALKDVADREIADLRAENAALRAALARHDDDIATPMGEYPAL